MQSPYKIAICGAGPTAQALTLFLLKKGLPKSSLIIIDAKTKQQATSDKRTLALSYGTHQLLQSIHAAPIKTTEILQIHVSRAGHFGRTLIDCKQQQVPALGYVARYADIISPLTDAIEQHGPDLTFLRPAKVVNITQCDTHAQIELDNQRTIQAQLVIQAEGGLFNDQTPQARHHDYQQSAIVASVKTSKPIAARAYERFTDQGPLALLPQEDGYALVWCVPPKSADQIVKMDDATFLTALQQAFGDRLGKFTTTGPRAVFALGLNAQNGEQSGRIVCIGNAAQTLHPVAGQGLNLGVRDAFQLAQALGKTVSPAALHEFVAQRSADRERTIHLTDRLAQLFIRSDAGGGAQQSILGVGLGLLDIFPPARHWLAGQMMFGKR